jgi:hypothetical protein
MRDRCLNAGNKDFHHYGARGITICERWSTFENFLADMGPKPSNQHSIERVENHIGYGPENCVWATAKRQSNNTRKTIRVFINGSSMSLTEACRLLSVPYQTAWRRVKQGWMVEQALYAAANHVPVTIPRSMA